MIAYFNPLGSTSLAVATYVGSGGNCGEGSATGKWQCDIVEASSGTSYSIKEFNPSITITSKGTPVIAYTAEELNLDKAFLKAATYVGSGGNCGEGSATGKWQCDVIDEEDDTLFVDTSIVAL